MAEHKYKPDEEVIYAGGSYYVVRIEGDKLFLQSKGIVSLVVGVNINSHLLRPLTKEELKVEAETVKQEESPAKKRNKPTQLKKAPPLKKKAG